MDIGGSDVAIAETEFNGYVPSLDNHFVEDFSVVDKETHNFIADKESDPSNSGLCANGIYISSEFIMFFAQG